MPQATNLIIADGAATSKTFTLISPAAGYGGVAEWKLKEGTTSAAFMVVTYSAERDTQRRTARGKGKFRFPTVYTDSTTGLTKSGPAAEFNFTATVPDDFPESFKVHFAAYVQNWLKTALFTEVLKDATPCT